MRRLLLLLLTCGLSSARPTPGVLTIRFLDVGQGDAVLITSPEGKGLLYDGGRSEARMRELVRQYRPQSIDIVVSSHADADHSTGLITAVALYKPQYFINNGIAGTTATWQKLINVVSQAGTQGVKATGQTITLGSVTVTVLPPPAGMPAEQNVNSVGLLVQYGTFKALMTGDSEPQETDAWLKTTTLGPVDVYKAIHHGSQNGDTVRWLRAVQPKNVVVSVGPNSYGHPAASALTMYRLLGATTWRTDEQGTVTVTVQPGGAYAITSERNAPRSPVAVPTPTPAPPGPTGDVSYPNCAAVRAAGMSPLLRGQPGYRVGLDRDGDGRACE